MRNKIVLPLTIHSRHISKDVGLLHDAINNSIINIDLSIDPIAHKRFESYLADIQQTDFQASFIQYGANTNVLCLQDNYYCLVIPYSGEHAIQHNKFNFIQNNKASFIPPNTEIDMKYSANCGHLVLRFESSPFNDEIFKSFYDPKFILNPLIQSRLQQIALSFIHSCCFLNEHSENSTIINNLKQDIYDSVLNYSAFNNFSYPDIEKNNICDVVKFINDNIQWEYNVEDLANITQTPLRTLYWRFKKYTGITPYRYHLNCKLKCARLDIIKFGSNLTITEIATQYGFVHLSRFSSHYKSLFGELPKTTMERSNVKTLRQRNTDLML